MTLQKAILRNYLRQRIAEVMFHTINDEKLVDRFYSSEQPPFQILLKLILDIEYLGLDFCRS